MTRRKEASIPGVHPPNRPDDGGSFEQGPIRPPSEALSLLVRVSRNCPWNRCAFCPVYKGRRFSRRSVAEVLADLDALARLHGDAPRTVFLQDADPLVARPDDLVEILAGIRERFPGVRRITTYARSRTIGRRSPEDLARIRRAGLDRLHVGMESGCDEVLERVRKGATRKDHVEAGRRAKDAGFSLCFYVMPGLGGRALSGAHADDTASALAAVEPHHVRLRTTVAVPGTPLWGLDGYEPLDDLETVREIRQLLAGLGGASLRIESDHVLNLLMDLRGSLPADRDALLAHCDAFLGLPEEERDLFVLGRRAGRVRALREISRPGVREELLGLRRLLLRRGLSVREFARAMMGRMV